MNGLIVSFWLVLVTTSVVHAGSLQPMALAETKLYREVAKNCIPMDLATLSHRVKKVLEKRDGVSLKWMEICNQGSYPIFGVNFKYDPRGRTNDYFTPLYLEILQANEGRPLSFISLPDWIMIHFSITGSREIKVRYKSYRDEGVVLE